MIIGYGDKGFERAIDRFDKHVTNKVKRVVIETAEMTVSQMKALAPVDEGNLRDSIDVTYMNGGLSAVITVGASYALYIEYGTGIYAKAGNGRKTPWVYFKDGRYYTTRGMKAQPFFHPSLETAFQYFKSEMNKIG